MRADLDEPSGRAESARYFFSIRYRDRLFPDQEGIDLPAGSDLEACARYLADRLRNDRALAEIPLAGCAVEVTDRQDRLLLTVFLPAEPRAEPARP